MTFRVREKVHRGTAGDSVINTFITHFQLSHSPFQDAQSATIALSETLLMYRQFHECAAVRQIHCGYHLGIGIAVQMLSAGSAAS
jgi:hypothetical protein